MTRDPGLASWLQLTLTPGLGPAKLRELLKVFGLPERVVAAGRAQLGGRLEPAVIESLLSEPVTRAVQKALDWAEAPNRALVTFSDPRYPELLLEIPDPPALLYVEGRLELLGRPALAVVGSRNCTAQGERDAERFARAFGDAGLTIVSGLALGIDAAAHRGGLGSRGSTLAVLGTGVDVVYPARNAGLAEQIRREGLLLSEFPLGTKALSHNFPRRNRLISGIAQGCLVVEAALASGSLITARAAADQGRDVFAIPGSIHSPLSKGCHALIKAGAKLVESAEDLLAELSAFRGAARAPAPRAGGASRDGAEEPLLAQMGFDPVDVDSLCARVGLSAEKVAAELLRLELAGRVSSLPGGLFQRLS